MLSRQQGAMFAALFATWSLFAVTADARSKHPPHGKVESRIPQAQTEHGQQQPAADERGTEQSPAIVRVLPTPKTEAEVAEEARERNEKSDLDRKLVEYNGDLAFYTEILAAFALLQIAALFVQARYLARTVKVSEAAAVAARESADAVVGQLRAYVSVHSSAIEGFGTNAIRIQVVIRNTGQTPAHDLITWMGVHLGQFPLTEELNPPPAGLHTSRGTLSPGVEQFLFDQRELTDQDNAEIIAGRTAIYVYGEIRYKDVFKKKRITRFRYLYGGGHLGPGGALATDAEGNEAT